MHGLSLYYSNRPCSDVAAGLLDWQLIVFVCLVGR